MNEPTRDIKEFFGLRNKQNPRRLPPGSLVRAENIDIDDSLGVVLRSGYQRVSTQNGITASFATQDERRLFIVEEGTLYLADRNMALTELKADVGSGYVYWLEVADFVLMSSGYVIDVNNNVASWRVPRPATPTVGIVSGSLPKGQYQITTTYVDSTGREGGASTSVVVDMAADSGLQVSPSILPGLTIKVYVTDTDGTIFYKVSEGNVGVLLQNMQGYTSPLDGIQLIADVLPENADVLGFYQSRLWACQTQDGQSVIWFSQPFWWNLFELFGDYLTVPGSVNALIGTDQGMIIATDDEIYVYTVEDSLVRLAEYGVPKGVPYTKDDTGKVFLWTNQGMCELFPFKNLTEDKVSVSPGRSAHLELVSQQGFEKLVVLTDGQGRNDNDRK